jgi:hypothetical protein
MTRRDNNARPAVPWHAERHHLSDTSSRSRRRTSQGGLPPHRTAGSPFEGSSPLCGDTRIEQRSVPFVRCEHRMSALPGSNRRADYALRRKANRRNSMLKDPSLGSDSDCSSGLFWPRIVGHLERQPSIWHPQVPGWATVYPSPGQRQVDGRCPGLSVSPLPPGGAAVTPVMDCRPPSSSLGWGTRSAFLSMAGTEAVARQPRATVRNRSSHWLPEGPQLGSFSLTNIALYQHFCERTTGFEPATLTWQGPNLPPGSVLQCADVGFCTICSRSSDLSSALS